MRRTFIPALAIMALALTACDASTIADPVAPPSLARANTVKENVMIDVPATEYPDPCGGESIIVSGKGHLVTTIIDNGDGTFSSRAHINYAGISGYGVLTGLKYQLVATQKQSTILTEVGEANTVQTQVGLISQGSDDNYQGRALVEFGFDGTDWYSIRLRYRERCGQEELP